MSDNKVGDAERVECINCGGMVEGEEAVFSSGGVKEDGLNKLLVEEESVPASELFGFDDGPYCSLDCSMDSAGE